MAGHYRMGLVYKMLSQDLLEACGSFSGEAQNDEPEPMLGLLYQRIQEATGSDMDLIRSTLQSFIEAGYIKFRKEDHSLIWYWTHNNQVD